MLLSDISQQSRSVFRDAFARSTKIFLGQGIYSGADQDKIRIETKCSNKFRNDFIEGNNYEELLINPYLKPSMLSKYAEGIGDSYCNLISYKIIKLITNKQLKSEYTFLHIAQTMRTATAITEIDSLIKAFKKSVKIDT